MAEASDPYHSHLHAWLGQSLKRLEGRNASAEQRPDNLQGDTRRDRKGKVLMHSDARGVASVVNELLGLVAPGVVEAHESGAAVFNAFRAIAAVRAALALRAKADSLTYLDLRHLASDRNDLAHHLVARHHWVALCSVHWRN